MATVYLAVQESMGREVALKVMFTDGLSDVSFGDRFIREAKIIARLSHPHIVPVFDVGRTDQCYFLAMEYIANYDLAERIKQGMKPGQILKVARDIASALDFAHKKGYIHRDVKPENILFRDDGTAVLTDFGIARPIPADAQMTQVGKVIGTPRYMSPEQIRGTEVEASTDLYALGIVLFEMLTGKVPFDGNDAFDIGMRHLNDPVPRLPSNMLIFQRLIDGLLAKKKAERIQSGKQVVDALDAIHQVLRQKANQTKSPANKTANNTIISNPVDVLRADSRDIYKADTLIRGKMQADAQDRPKQKSDSRWITPDMPTPGAKKRSRAPIIATLFFVTLLSVAVVLLMAPLLAPKSSLADLHNNIKSYFIKAEPVVDLRAQAIEEALAAAKSAMVNQHYFAPEEGSAYQSFQQVLALDELNSEAKQGLLDIAAQFISQALNHIENGQLLEARAQLDQAKKVASHAPGIMAAELALRRKEQESLQQIQQQQAQAQMLQNEKLAAQKAAQAAAAEKERLLKIQQQKEKEQRELLAKQKAENDASEALFRNVRIRGLLAKASTHTARGELHSPINNNALSTYAEVLELDGSNGDAISGINQTVNAVLNELRQLQQEGRKQDAQALYTTVLQYAQDKAPLYQFAEQAGW